MNLLAVVAFSCLIACALLLTILSMVTNIFFCFVMKGNSGTVTKMLWLVLHGELKESRWLHNTLLVNLTLNSSNSVSFWNTDDTSPAGTYFPALPFLWICPMDPKLPVPLVRNKSLRLCRTAGQQIGGEVDRGHLVRWTWGPPPDGRGPVDAGAGESHYSVPLFHQVWGFPFTNRFEASLCLSHAGWQCPSSVSFISEFRESRSISLESHH